MATATANLIVVALGGNAISPPHGDLSLPGERTLIHRAAAELALLAARGCRLLVVHGNGPQVGRLLAAPGIGNADCLDIHVAQTQGELGYLLAEALDESLGSHATVALVTRVLVNPADAAFTHPTKPVGAVLPAPPDGVPAVRTPDGRGWRRVVASPRPLAVLERAAIAGLLASHHVVAGGGGGIPLAGSVRDHRASPAVIDKDWVAALLATTFFAARLLFVTDVPHACDRFGEDGQRPLTDLSVREAHERLERNVFAPGSMAPKIESAVQFTERTGRPSVITTIGAIDAALAGRTGTTIHL